jgi:hypothetical protein
MELAAIYAHERTLKDAHLSEENFSARDFHNISTDANVTDALIVFFSRDEDTAGPFHFDSLFDQHPFSRIGNTVRCHPNSATSGS